jgi:hypothetical protein
VWFARPDSAFRLWRTPQKIQTCQTVKHLELQKYLIWRIKGHSRDVGRWGRDAQAVEAEICGAVSRVWRASAQEIGGPGLVASWNQVQEDRGMARDDD